MRYTSACFTSQQQGRLPMAETTLKVQPIIEVENLTKRYKGAKDSAVNAISFSVRAGEFFTLLGPNGAGKTTTISILTTTLNPTSGTARIAGYDIRHRGEYSAPKHRNHLSTTKFGFQSYS